MGPGLLASRTYFFELVPRLNLEVNFSTRPAVSMRTATRLARRLCRSLVSGGHACASDDPGHSGNCGVARLPVASWLSAILIAR